MSNGRDKPQAGIKLEDVCFYFDGIERDRLDAAGLSRKAGEVLALRDRLLKLPPAEFDAVIRTLRQLIAETPGDPGTAAQTTQRARLLYDHTRPVGGSGSAASTKVSPT